MHKAITFKSASNRMDILDDMLPLQRKCVIRHNLMCTFTELMSLLSGTPLPNKGKFVRFLFFVSAC
jgi:hypothetical protein